VIERVHAALPADLPVWVVGGAVRDALLLHRVHDLDFVVRGEALAAARRVADALKAAFYPLDADRDVGRVILAQDDERLTLDFARLRGPDLDADLSARDFTVNAMAASLAEPDRLIDPLGGLADLRAKTIRVCSPSAIADDPVRGVRAVRLAAQLRFRIDQGTRAQIRAQASALARVSAERLRDEFIRCLGGPRPAAAMRALDLLGLLPHIVPELSALKGLTQSPPHEFDVWEHTLATVAHLNEALNVLGLVHDVDAASDLTLGLVSVRLGRFRQALADHLRAPVSGDRPARWLLMLAALLHDVGKATTRTVGPEDRIRFLEHEAVSAEMAAQRLAALRFSGDEIKRARLILQNHMRPAQLAKAPPISSRAVYRFFRDTGEAGVDIVLLSLGDQLGKYHASPPQESWSRHLDACATLLGAYFERRAEAVSPPALITGHDLMSELGLEPGPQLGEILDAVREAQAAGEIADRAAALEYARKFVHR
jgi:putative nucleotidyltransferase with HDIG domain